jgi:hypothetical protein
MNKSLLMSAMQALKINPHALRLLLSLQGICQ